MANEKGASIQSSNKIDVIILQPRQFRLLCSAGWLTGWLAAYFFLSPFITSLHFIYIDRWSAVVEIGIIQSIHIQSFIETIKILKSTESMP